MSEWTPKIVAFLCTWCSYAGADLAGTGRNQYPPNVRVIRIPCSGRINPLYIIKALLEGADCVMVSGCHPGDCHYLAGNYYARRRFTVLKKLLTTAGFDSDRVQFTWVSASEGVRFADVIKEVTAKAIALGPNLVTGTVVNPLNKINTDSGDASSQVLKESNEIKCEYEKQQNQLISFCRRLLEDGTVFSMIGYRAAEPEDESNLCIPFFIDNPGQTDKLVWNSRCVPNLSGYLIGRKEKTAIAAKPCDARAVVNLIRENQLKRDDVYIIGLTCNGMVDEKGDVLPACLECTVHIPPVYDVLVDTDAEPREPSPRLDTDAEPREPSPRFENLDRFIGEIDKCILCYSCRQSCYGCYCKTCFIERGEPDWLPASPDTGTKMLYHLGRSTHLSGRCVECGACENACASGVDIRYLIKAVTGFIKDTYDYQTGMDLDSESAMLTYKTDDPETGFLGGDSNA